LDSTGGAGATAVRGNTGRSVVGGCGGNARVTVRRDEDCTFTGDDAAAAVVCAGRSGGMLRVGVAAASTGPANAVASTSVMPPTATDTKHSITTIAVASAPDQTDAIGCWRDTIFTTRARRPDGVNMPGAVWIARDVPFSPESLIRHLAYDFGNPVRATVISSQAISRSTCSRRSIR